MSIFTLIFQSPSKLNEAREVTKAKKYLWVHADYKGFDNGGLEFDIETNKIFCSEKSINEPINIWEVNEEDYTMKLRSENINGNFKPLDYSFAVSMLGQLVPPAKLIEYLKGLQEVYGIAMDTSNN